MEERKQEPREELKKAPFSHHTQERFPDAESILDPTSTFEEMDRGEGMGVDDIKTYTHQEK